MNTVILVHGFTFAPRRMRHMAAYLEKRGWNVLRPELRPSNGQARLEALAAQLGAFIDRHTALGERIDLVGFSMGGLICRYWLQCLGGASRTDRFVSIASPNNGTHIARLLPGAGMRQMRPGSRFLQDLNADTGALRRVTCSVLYTKQDLVIVPATSSLVPFARPYKLGVLSHPMMIYHPAVYRKLETLLLE